MFASLQVENTGQKHVSCARAQNAGPGSEPEKAADLKTKALQFTEQSPTGLRFAPWGRAECIALSLWVGSSPKEGL